MDCSPPGFSVLGILQARILERVAMPSSREPSDPGDQNHVSYISCTGKQVHYHQGHLGHISKKDILMVHEIDTNDMKR